MSMQIICEMLISLIESIVEHKPIDNKIFRNLLRLSVSRINARKSM